MLFRIVTEGEAKPSKSEKNRGSPIAFNGRDAVAYFRVRGILKIRRGHSWAGLFKVMLVPPSSR